MNLRKTLLLVAAPAALSLALLTPLRQALADQPGDKDAKPAAPDPTAGVAAPGENDKKDEAAPQQAKVSPEARQVVDQVDAAYSKIKSLELAGVFSADLDAAGEQRKESKKFNASYAAPNKFRHLMEDDILVGSTGAKAYAYLQDRNLYTQSEAPKEKAQLQAMPEPIPQVIQMQNPALMLAVVKSASAELGTMFTEIKKVEDTKITGESAALPTLQLTLPNKMVVTMAFHPETHLLRQARTDIKPMLLERGTPDVKNATLTVDYTTVKADADASVKDEQFAWAPPQDAKDMAEVAAAQGPAGGGGEASELEGKAAPSFELMDMADKKVALGDLKGKVVVLDMWATWCLPCRASLPHLDKLTESVKGKDVAVYAVNMQEDKDDVQKFIDSTKLKTPVLLDSKGSVGQAYKANAIPQTVVIGKDGKVRKVFVGFGGEESAKALKNAVEEAMK